jgi:hypothetical protein
VKKIVFIISFLMLLKPVMPVIEYVFNYDYITAELCENKDKPLMRCNGKCYLMKELAKAAENEKPLSSDKKHASTETNDLFLEFAPDYTTVFFQNQSGFILNAVYSNSYSYLNAHSFFHPPTVIS